MRNLLLLVLAAALGTLLWYFFHLRLLATVHYAVASLEAVHVPRV